MKNYLLLLAVVGIFTIASCSDPNDPLPSDTEMITDKTWKITARTQVLTDTTGTATTSTALDSCELDDTYTFATDNVLTIDEGATKCDTLAPQTVKGTWALSDNDTKLTITVGQASVPGNVLELSSSKLVVETTVDISSSDVLVTTSTFTAQ